MSLSESPVIGSTRYGACVATSNGEFMATTNGSLRCQQDPLLAEAMACRDALSWLKDKSFLNIRIKYDCLNLVYA